MGAFRRDPHGELMHLASYAPFAHPQQWIGIFRQDPSVYVLYCAGQGTERMGASVLAERVRAAIAVLGGLLVVWPRADVTWNFVAVALGMVAFGLFAFAASVSRSGY